MLRSFSVCSSSVGVLLSSFDVSIGIHHLHAFSVHGGDIGAAFDAHGRVGLTHDSLRHQRRLSVAVKHEHGGAASGDAASERTRLLSVESMKMEDVREFKDGDLVNNLLREDEMERNELRQSILSEMEKGGI